MISGQCLVTPKKLVPGSVEWAQLENAPAMTVSQFLDNMTQHNDKEGKGQNASQQLYLFDWSLALYCPKLAEELTIPKYFAGKHILHSCLVI